MKKQYAFTLIELLLTSLILMALIAIASPSYHSLFSHQALISRSQSIYQFLTLARSQAIKSEQKIYVHFCQHNITQEWVMAQSTQAKCDCFSVNSCQVNGAQFNLPISQGRLVFLTASDITFNKLRISYNTMRFSVNAGSITLHDSHDHRLKIIQSSMRLRICSVGSANFGYQQC